MHSQEGVRVELTGKAQERQTPVEIETHKKSRVRGETPHVAGM